MDDEHPGGANLFVDRPEDRGNLAVTAAAWEQRVRLGDPGQGPRQIAVIVAQVGLDPRHGCRHGFLNPRPTAGSPSAFTSAASCSRGCVNQRS
jgi:hypothetical protein